MNECLWLVHNGIPADIAFGTSHEELSAWVAKSDARRTFMAIKFSIFNGAKFDVNTMSFIEENH